MPMIPHSEGWKWSWLTHSGRTDRDHRIDIKRGYRITLWFPKKMLVYEEEVSKYGCANPTGWQPLKDLWKYLREVKEHRK